MIEVIKYGYIDQCQCNSCQSILSFNRREDMKEVPVGDERIYFYINCPVCLNDVLVGWGWKEGSVFYPSGNIVED